MRRVSTSLVDAAAVVSVVAWASAATAGILKGPHLQNVRQDGVTILWEQETAGPGTVTIGSQVFSSPASLLVHEVVISGRSPDTTYLYTVDADGSSETGSFITAPSDPLAPFVFVAVGDNRSNHSDHQMVVDAIRAEADVSFMVNTGDMVSSGEVAADWQTFFDVERLLIRDLPWYSTIGNHEEDGGELPPYYTRYLAPPDSAPGGEAYYSFTYANSAFIVLDGHVNVVDKLFGLWTDFNGDQQTWLAGVLTQYSQDPTIQHVFVFTHEPPYSSKDGRTGSHALRLLLPLFAQHGVDAIINGHDHYLERGESPQGIPYFIMGGGGAPLYDNSSVGDLGPKTASALPWFDDAHTVHFAQSTNGYMVVSVENGQVDVSIKDIGGAVLDTVSWNTGDLVVQVDAGVPDAPHPVDAARDTALPFPDAWPAQDAHDPADQQPPPGGDQGAGGGGGGCGCRVGGTRHHPALPLLVVLVGSALVGTRRRRRPR